MFHSPSIPGRWLCVLLLVLAMLSLPAGADAARRARAAVMINLSNGKVLYEHNPNLSIPPASLTKVMTMYVVMDRIKMGRLKRSTSIRVHPTARVGGSSMRLRPRQRVTVDQLLTGMAVASGNDAAMAISQHISGNSRNFTHLMNHKARQLGMTRTVYHNAHGLPDARQAVARWLGSQKRRGSIGGQRGLQAVARQSPGGAGRMCAAAVPPALTRPAAPRRCARPAPGRRSCPGRCASAPR